MVLKPREGSRSSPQTFHEPLDCHLTEKFVFFFTFAKWRDGLKILFPCARLHPPHFLQKNDFGVEKTAKSWQKSHEISVRRVVSRTCSGMYEEMATRQTESGVDEKEQTHLLKASFMAARHQKSIQGNGCVACT